MQLLLIQYYYLIQRINLHKAVLKKTRQMPKYQSEIIGEAAGGGGSGASASAVRLTSFVPLDSEVHELRELGKEINIQDVSTNCKIDNNNIQNEDNNKFTARIFSSKLYFRNGKVGCYEADIQPQCNVQATHAIVKHILANSKHMAQLCNENSKEPTTITKNYANDEVSPNVELHYNELPDVLNEKQNIDNSCIQSNISDSKASSINEKDQQFLREQMQHLVRRFHARTNSIKSRLAVPPTPSESLGSQSTESETTVVRPVVRVVPTPIKTAVGINLFEADAPRSNFWRVTGFCGNNDEHTLDPQGKIYISWLCVVSLSFLYNAWVIPMRSTFPFQTPENLNYWLIADYVADVIYLLDVAFFKHRVMYLFEGFWVKDKNLTRKNYMRKLQFKVNLIYLIN